MVGIVVIGLTDLPDYFGANALLAPPVPTALHLDDTDEGSASIPCLACAQKTCQPKTEQIVSTEVGDIIEFRQSINQSSFYHF